MSSYGPADERPHLAEVAPGWSESWEMRLVDPRERVAVVIAVIRRPAEQRASYLASIIAPDRSTVSVLEHELAEPGVGLELRGPAIWADQVCESPFVHWSLGLEAFGLRFDDPLDAVGLGRGEVVPVGFDLEWEDQAGPEEVDSGPGYRADGSAHGEVLVGTDRLEVEGFGGRVHRWGTGPRLATWSLGPAADPDARPIARALAADDTGATVEWCLVEVPDDGPGGLALVSSLVPAAPV